MQSPCKLTDNMYQTMGTPWRLVLHLSILTGSGEPWQPSKSTPAGGRAVFPLCPAGLIPRPIAGLARQGRPSSYPTAPGLRLYRSGPTGCPFHRSCPDIFKSRRAPGCSTMMPVVSSLLCHSPPLRDETFISETEMIPTRPKYSGNSR